MLYQKLESPINGVVYNKEGNLLRQWSRCTLKRCVVGEVDLFPLLKAT